MNRDVRPRPSRGWPGWSECATDSIWERVDGTKSTASACSVLFEGVLDDVQGVVDVIGGYAVVGDETPSTHGGASLDTPVAELASQPSWLAGADVEEHQVGG